MSKVVAPASFHVGRLRLMPVGPWPKASSVGCVINGLIAESADLSFRLLPKAMRCSTVHGDQSPPPGKVPRPRCRALALCGWLTGRTLRRRQVLVEGDQPANIDPTNKASTRRWCLRAYDALIFERADMEAPLQRPMRAMALLP